MTLRAVPDQAERLRAALAVEEHRQVERRRYIEKLEQLVRDRERELINMRARLAREEEPVSNTLADTVCSTWNANRRNR